MTSPRGTAKPFELLERTVAAVDAEDLEDVRKTIVFDGDAEAFLAASDLIGTGADWAWCRFEKDPTTWIGGNKATYFHILGLAARLELDALIVEDDLIPSRNAYTRALLFPVPSDVAFVQFFSGFTLRNKDMEPGLWRTPATVQGTQAIKFPLRTLRALTDWQKNDPEFLKYRGSDDALELARRRLALRPACHCPDIFEHDGLVSAVSEGMMLEGGITDVPDEARALHLSNRQSKTWPGPTFDAIRLFARHDLFK